MAAATRQHRRAIDGIGCLLGVCLLGAGLVPETAYAQVAVAPPSAVRRPYRGLFGQPAASGAGQSLDLSASVYGAYDDDIFADQGVGVNSGVRESGWFEGAQAELAYGRQKGRLGLGATTGVGVTRHSRPAEFLPIYHVGGNLGYKLGPRTQMSLTESFVYAPEFRLGLFVSPEDGGGFADPFLFIAPDVGLFSERSYRTNTGVAVTQRLSKDSSLDGYYSLTTASYPGANADYRSQGGGLRFSRGLSRHASLRLGYGYGVGRYTNVPGLRRRGVHTIDAGVNYDRALSVSRRTSFSFSTGSALYASSDRVGPAARERINYALLGNANLTHEMGRTWTATLSYRRSLDFHEGFADPFLSQALSANVGGLVGRRVSVSASAALTRGLVGVATTNNFDSANATARLQYALTRYLAAYASYVYYRYHFDTSVSVDPRLPRSLDRQGIRLGLSTSIPLIR